jgi:hypothetical protein
MLKSVILALVLLCAASSQAEEVKISKLEPWKLPCQTTMNYVIPANAPAQQQMLFQKYLNSIHSRMTRLLSSCSAPLPGTILIVWHRGLVTASVISQNGSGRGFRYNSFELQPTEPELVRRAQDDSKVLHGKLKELSLPVSAAKY